MLGRIYNRFSSRLQPIRRQLRRARVGIRAVVAEPQCLIPILAALVAFWLPVTWWLLGWLIRDLETLGSLRPGQVRILINTVLIGGGSVAGALLIAYPIAFGWWLARTRFLRGMVIVLVFVPVVMGLLARNYSWIGMLSGAPIGLGRLLYTTPAVLIVMTYIFAPVAFFLICTSLQSLPRLQIESAATCGATPIEILRFVAFPRTLRHAVLAALLVFAQATVYFVTPRMIGGGQVDMLGNALLTRFEHGDFAQASAESALFLVAIVPPYLLLFGILAARRRRRHGD